MKGKDNERERESRRERETLKRQFFLKIIAYILKESKYTACGNKDHNITYNKSQ